MKVPRHVGFIMDGNGRWALARGKRREAGHREGVKRVREIVSHAFSRGVEVVSLYAFSTENWSRPKKEVDELFRLIRRYFAVNLKKMLSDGIRLQIMGDLSVFPEDIRRDFEDSMQKTAHFTAHVLNVAINYGGRQELCHAMQAVCNKGLDITPETVQNHLYTANLPDLDLVIRTSGEQRLSNFMLWQSAYAEFYFTPVLWPDFHKEDLDKALDDYATRHRRFGGVEQEETHAKKNA